MNLFWSSWRGMGLSERDNPNNELYKEIAILLNKAVFFIYIEISGRADLSLLKVL
jgi:hypothetical protein